MKQIFTIMMLLTSTAAAAQNFNVRGVILNNEGEFLPSATVTLLKARDSTLVNYTVTDEKGVFELKIPSGEWLIKVTYIGFHPYLRKINSPSGDVLDIGEIRLQPHTQELDGVTVRGEAIPVTIKKDTIAYNAKAFKTQNNAVVEDLLKQLPGVEVDPEGEITAQGEKVERVLVDGKEFFGRDPKMATRNLPADAVENVQVIDAKSEQARFSGIDDGKREKVINLELKEDRKHGAFGSAMAGAGSEGRLEAKTNVNRFNRGNQLSVLGMANNTNQPGFSISDYLNFTGASAQMGGRRGGRIRVNAKDISEIPVNPDRSNNGIMSTVAGGINFNQTLNKDVEVNGSYFYNNLEHDITQSLVRENFQPDPENNFNYFEDGSQENINMSHRGNMTIDYAIDSANSLRFNGNISLNNTAINAINNSQTVRSDGVLQNESSQVSASSGNAVNSNANLLYRHRFPKKGRTISLNTDFVFSANGYDGTLEAVNNFYSPQPSETILNQEFNQNTVTSNLGATLSFTEPLGGKKYLEANYSIRQNRNNVDQEVYDVENGSRAFNDQLSNIYSSDYLYQRGGLNFQLNQENFNLTLGLGYQQTRLEGQLENHDAGISQHFENVLPVARFSYEFNRHKRMTVDYTTSVQEPTIQQLQPVVDNSNPLNIYEGNPNLKPSYAHNLRLFFNTFDHMKFLGFLSGVDISFINNAIINAQQIDEQFIRFTTPVNFGNSLDIRAHANFSFPVTAIKSRFNIGPSFRDHHSSTMLNDIASDIRQTSLSLNLRYTFRFEEILNLHLSSSLNKQISNYEQDQPDQAFINSRYKAETHWNFYKDYRLSAYYELLYYKNDDLNFSEDISLVNLSLARSFLKNDKGELKLSVINLLNEDVGVVQHAGLNYVERQTTNSLGRYFMLGFTYTLNKQLDPTAGRRGGVRIRHDGNRLENRD